VKAGFDRSALQFKALAAESAQIGAKTGENAGRGEAERLVRAGVNPESGAIKRLKEVHP
jgi:hypothetical protein